MKDKILKEFDERFAEYIKDISIGQYNENEVNIGFLSAKEVIKQFLIKAIDQTREEVNDIKEIQNKVKCVGFSEDKDFVCDKVLPISEMKATIKEPTRFYCKECYERGLNMEYEAMGLR